jgi:hypothetical protein
MPTIREKIFALSNINGTATIREHLASANSRPAYLEAKVEVLDGIEVSSQVSDEQITVTVEVEE